MTKTKVYIGLLAVFLIVALGLFIKEKTKYDPALERDFTVHNMEALGKIELSDRAGNAMTLEKVNNQWLIDGKDEVRPAILKDLLAALGGMYADMPVPKVAQENVYAEMTNHSTKVVLYNLDEKKPFKVFYVGGSTHDKEGTYMLMEIKGKAASQPFVVKLAGFRGYLTYRFAPLVDSWRSIAYCDYLPEELESVSIQYKQEDAQESFKLVKDKNSFELQAYGKTFSNDEVNYEMALSLFSSFMKLHFEEHMDDLENKDSIMQNFAFLDLELITYEGEERHLSVYYTPLGEGSAASADSSIVFQYDMDRLYAYDHERNKFISIQYATFGPMFLKANQFFKSTQYSLL